jgi:hypothetical protein
MCYQYFTGTGISTTDEIRWYHRIEDLETSAFICRHLTDTGTSSTCESHWSCHTEMPNPARHQHLLVNISLVQGQVRYTGADRGSSETNAFKTLFRYMTFTVTFTGNLKSRGLDFSLNALLDAHQECVAAAELFGIAERSRPGGQSRFDDSSV